LISKARLRLADSRLAMLLGALHTGKLSLRE